LLSKDEARRIAVNIYRNCLKGKTECAVTLNNQRASRNYVHPQNHFFRNLLFGRGGLRAACRDKSMMATAIMATMIEVRPDYRG
jgi:hypothetical protein